MNKDVRRYTLVGLYLLLFSLLCGRAFAKERYEFYNGVRQLGMGGVAVATVNDETALMLNPAGLGKLRNTFGTLADPEIESGSGLYDYLKAEDWDYSEFISAQNILNLLNANPDEHYHMKAQISPSVVFQNFGIGSLANWNYDAEVDSTTNEIKLRYRSDYAALLGYNLRLFDGRIKIGVTGRYIDRAEVDDEYDTSSTNLEWDTLVNSGTGVAADVGLMLTGPWKYLPSIAAVWRDVGDTSYTMGDGFHYNNRPEPERTENSLDVGFSVTPILANNIRIQLAGEVRDVMENVKDDDSSDFSRRLHVGAELNVYDHIFIRGGMNQRYWTAGMELAFQFIQIQAASYGEEIGTKDETREDRRYVFKFSFRF